MRLDVFELVNAVTMVLPWMAWWKHRRARGKNRRVHSLLKNHVPISMVYHTLNSFLPGRGWTWVFKGLDIACIHATSVAAARDVMGVSPPRKRPWFFYGSLPLHAWALKRSLVGKDLPSLRFGLVLCNVYPVFCIVKERRVLRGAVGVGCYGSFQIAYRYPLGHGVFHALLYPMYDDFFTLLKSKEEEEDVNSQEA